MKSFRFFLDLPLEIQNKIWHYTFQPRVVTVRWSKEIQQYVSPDRPPAILNVSHAARTEGMKIYQSCFGTTSDSRSPIYFSYDFDTVFFDFGTVEHKPGNLESFPDSGKIQSLIIEASVLLAHYDNGMLVFRSLTSLRELKITCCHSVICNGIHQLDQLPVQILEGPKESVGQLAPTLTCLEGARCRKHWWFEDWNKGVALRTVKSWVDLFMVTRMMAVVEQQKRRRLDLGEAEVGCSPLGLDGDS